MSPPPSSIESMTGQQPNGESATALTAVQPGLFEAARSAPALPAGTTSKLPIAQVLLESPVPHLDRPFDYAVPVDLEEKVVPGSRVKVMFSGREMPGYVLKRLERSATAHRLSSIRRVVSPLPLLGEEILELAQRVAARYAGVTFDVLRAAIPQRVARVEKEFIGQQPPQTAQPAEEPGPREADLALKSYGEHSWAHQILHRVQQTLQAGGDAVVVVPDQRDAQEVASLLEDDLGTEVVARLSADMGPTPRYRSYLQLRYGQARVAVGTRSAVFAPVANLCQLIIFDDDDPSHAEPRAPYHHVREVALLRAVQTGAGILFLSTSRSLEVQRLVERGWLTETAPDRDARRAGTPLVTASSDSYQQERDPTLQQSRLPAVAFRSIRKGLEQGPVLIQVGRSGFVPAVICARCRTRQQCPECHGPLALPAHHGQSQSLRCRWCGIHQRGHRCAECGHREFRAAARGTERTGQELGRAFPNVPVILSTAGQSIPEVGEKPALVVSTPGVEPVAAAGYSAVILLDGDLQLMRDGLDVPRQVLSRWFRAGSLARSRSEGGAVVVTAESQELTGALVRWDPAGYARRELYRRLELNLPPATRMLSVTGEPTEVRGLIHEVKLPAGLDWIGPAEASGGESRWLLFFGYAQAEEVIAEIRRVRRTTSAKPQKGTTRALRIAVDDVSSLQF